MCALTGGGSGASVCTHRLRIQLSPIPAPTFWCVAVIGQTCGAQAPLEAVARPEQRQPGRQAERVGNARRRQCGRRWPPIACRRRALLLLLLYEGVILMRLSPASQVLWGCRKGG